MFAGRRVEYLALPGIPRVEPGDDVATLIRASMASQGLTFQTGDVVVVAQKIISKSEDRYVLLSDVQPSKAAVEMAAAVGKDPRFIQVVLDESEEVVKCGPHVVVVAHRLGFVMANAGIDQSNIEHNDGQERVLLLPRDPDEAARRLKAELENGSGCDLAVVINDSFGRPWRNGVVGVALGAAGLPSLLDQVGVTDMFGRAMRVTEIAVADEIASAASLLMGQADQALPVILVRGLELKGPRKPASALLRDKSTDMFR